MAVLFLCEIDNITYMILLSEKVRSRAEANGMRVEIGDAEAVSLSRTKAVHVALITVIVPAAVWTANNYAAFLAVIAFWLAGATEAVGDAASGGGGAAGAGKGLAKVTGAWLLGLVGIGVLAVVSVYL